MRKNETADKRLKKEYSNLVIIGLVGGIACGKSTVAGLLGRLGAVIIDADEITHGVLERPEVVRKIGAAFGPAVIVKGAVSRKRLAEAAFADAAGLKKLTDIVHPPVLAEVYARLRKLDSGPGRRAAVIEASLLVEAGLNVICDHVVYLSCALNQRLWRAKKNRSWTSDELKRREKFQLMLHDKRSASNYEINNNLSFEYTRRAAERFWKERVAPAIDAKTKSS
jgi:dephospho-CoA kinase